MKEIIAVLVKISGNKSKTAPILILAAKLSYSYNCIVLNRNRSINDRSGGH